ncbi:MAG: FAD-dependent oxidoreductase, partial [Thermoleophilia bacterium]|nr:FAD-dependent oxidoreductase [Thermoleophilia bacterium]
AVLAAAAGVPCEVGSPEFGGLNMSSTLGFRLANVNMAAYREAAEAWAADPERNPERLPFFQFYIYLEKQAVADGGLPYFIFPAALIYQVPGTKPEDADICIMTTHSMFCHNTDAEDVSRQIMEQHQQILWVESFLRKCAPGFEKCRVTGIANMHGIRDSRRAMGEYVLKDIDVATGAKFDDGIARFPEFFDTHHPTSREHGFMRHIHVAEPVDSPFCRPAPGGEELMHPFVNMSGYELRVDTSDYCDIPYRCLVPLGIENMFLAGRCLSAEFNAQAAVRIISVCMSSGQAAGVAAALCAKNGVTPRQLDGTLVRTVMIEQGAEVHKMPDGYWAEVRDHIKQTLAAGGKIRVLPGDFVIVEESES